MKDIVGLKGIQFLQNVKKNFFNNEISYFDIVKCLIVSRLAVVLRPIKVDSIKYYNHIRVCICELKWGFFYTSDINLLKITCVMRGNNTNN